jgi:hypothetical protein
MTSEQETPKDNVIQLPGTLHFKDGTPNPHFIRGPIEHPGYSPGEMTERDKHRETYGDFFSNGHYDPYARGHNVASQAVKGTIEDHQP